MLLRAINKGQEVVEYRDHPKPEVKQHREEEICQCK